MKIGNTILSLCFFTGITLSQTVTYLGPDSGGVSSGVMVTTDNFTRVMQTGEPKERGIRNAAQVKYDESLNTLVSYTAPEDRNYFEDPNANISTKENNAQTVLLQDFVGISMGNSIPPDPIMAVGPNHILACVNTDFAIWDKKGNLLKHISADSWYGSVLSSPGAFDPQVIYDHYDGRWFMLWDSQQDNPARAEFLISVSDDDDPTGIWYNYSLPANVMGSDTVNTWGDYPQIGFDDKAIYINSRQFTFPSTSSSKVYDRIRILNKAEYYAAEGGPVSWNDIYNISFPGNGQKPDVIHPVIMYSSSSDFYFINTIRIPNPSVNFISLYKLSNPLTNPVLTGVNINVTPYYRAPDANQLGGGTPLISSNESGMKSSPIYRDGFIWSVHSVRNPTSTSSSSIRYYKIDVSDNSIAEEATFGAANHWYLFPNLVVDKDQNIAINYTRTSTTEYAGAFYTTRLANDSPGLNGSMLLKEGEGNYNVTFGGTRNRWGDYHGLYLDPVTEYNIWMFTEYAASPNRWSTWVGEIRIAPFSGAHIYTSSTALEFGNIEINSVSDTLSLVVTNYGEDQLIINSLPDSLGPFKLLTELSYPLTLNSYDSLTIEFDFEPTIPGVYEQVLSLNSNDPDFEGVTLRGRGFRITQALQNQLYASSGINNGGSILTINLSSGAGTILGESLFGEVKSIAINPKTGIMYGVVNSGSEAELVYFNAQGGDGYRLLFLSAANFAGISFDTLGTLYGILKTGELYTINLSDGSLTLVADADIAIAGIDFNPITNELWATTGVLISNKDKIFKIDLSTGDTVVVGKTGFNATHNDLVFDGSGNLYAAVGSATQENNLIQIDTATGMGTLIGSIGYSNITGLAYLVSGVTAVEEDDVVSIPTEYRLRQNYPNPFNPSTTIDFSLPVNSNVKLTVYNILGEVVNVLINSRLQAGPHSVNWNSTDRSGNKLVSGVYFFELKANGSNGSEFSGMKKMILLK